MEGTNSSIDNRPSIKVFYDCDHLSVSDFTNILLGIEEEGIPFDVHEEHSSDVLDLAYRASLESRLGVGVGISKEGVVLQYEKLDKAAPLFRIKLYQLDLFRSIGANAARLVKKMPFKPLD
ncbi:MAG: glycerol dehydratase reactivase beta/small subunit family protein [Eubacterium sp.]|nr:glycerol dehydratase reactivase beta/small subunit family protein [Eubacterium sp.]